jgi:antitoxin component YwqK of YwqJK toxin-antitoxin module
MKKLTPILILSLLFLSCGDSQKEYNNNDLVKMDNGLYTKKFSDEPITGKVYGFFGDKYHKKSVDLGNLRDGKKEGKWVLYYDTGKKHFEKYYKDNKLISEKYWNEDGSVRE